MARRVSNARSLKKELIEEKNSPIIKNPTSQTENKSKIQCFKRKRVASPSVAKVKLEGEVNLPAMVQARNLQLSLGTQFPSFIKLMCKSHVEAKQGQIRLPYDFCRLHLPEDKTLTLEDEAQEKFELKYKSRGRKFGGGWKTFLVSHNLQERDVLVFHLVEPAKFKVYISRDNYQLNVYPSLSAQNGQESSNLSSPFQELGTFEDPESKRDKLPLAGKENLERKQSSPATFQENRNQLTESPSFMRTIGNSNSFFLPRPFCTLHLPKEETTITLEDENGNQFEVKYFQTWMGFGAGWAAFADAHNLHKGDVLHFRLVDPKKFKVYITRVDDHQVTVNPSPLQQTEQGGSKSSDNPTDQFTDLGTFEEFQSKIGCLCSETELEDDTLHKYYEFCCSKNEILHNKTLNCMNGKLVAGIIGETVNIAAAIKSCNIFTPKEKLEQWENSLKSFKLLGMKVEFLIDRVSQLLKLRVKYEGTKFIDEMKNLEAKRENLKESYEKVGIQIENLKSRAKMHTVEFQQVIDSPW